MTEVGWAIKAFEALDPSAHPGELIVINSPFLYGDQLIKIARDIRGNPHLLIPLSHEKVEAQPAPLTAGLRVLVEEYPSDSGEMIPYLVLQSIRSDVDDLFAMITQDICTHLLEDPLKSPFQLFRERIEAWRALLSKLTPQIPNLQQQLGLLGELLFLEKLVNEDFENPVGLWQGPEGARHDFISVTWAAEVKTSLYLTKSSIHIHGSEQLKSNGERKLGLVLYQVERALGGTSIAKLLDSLSSKLPSKQLEQRLVSWFPDGIQKPLPSWASELEVAVYASKVFPVTKDFPVIRLADLGPKALRISRLNYELSIDGLPFESLDGQTWKSWIGSV